MLVATAKVSVNHDSNKACEQALASRRARLWHWLGQMAKTMNYAQMVNFK
ncbi:hypothetical protein KJY73_11925 [Bowmanella sp. Y26]|uniref:Transposase n=1 Tax=Bowmanella yangjiangensis TaxID=2811230 RepID=A0ABS3CRB1_9ALTE|nr:hypothetical protein [Bowmanella yangjiangensis]MBN7819653.1 hypothetical protein [Bowmanella yangjiangensis]MBT1064288.1 hypothetical protein [Bowmanella yangjiangensis]